MPTICVERESLLKKLTYYDQSINTKKLDDLCFDFGLELEEALEDNGKITYKIEVGSNRYDLLCVEGIVRSLLVYQGYIKLPKFLKYSPECVESLTSSMSKSSLQKLTIDASKLDYRPFCVAAVLKNITLDQERYDSFIDLQEKLHQNLGRKRSLFAIGTHDLDKVQGPFKYVGIDPRNIKFVPLNETNEFTAMQLMEKYSTESHLKPYLPLIKDKPVFPVIYDANNVVLSMPPIINGNKSRIELTTKNILIEVTGSDMTKINIALDTMVTMFLQYCSAPYDKVAECVEISTEKGNIWSPSLKYRSEVIHVKEIIRKIGVEFECNQIIHLLEKMGLSSKANGNDEIIVSIGPSRHDILHTCDIIEDVAIAYGINNIPKNIPKTISTHNKSTVAINSLSDYIRSLRCLSEFMEACTFVLVAKDDISKKMRKSIEETKVQMIEIANPKTSEFQAARTTLIPGLLKTLKENRHMALPIKLFEISDVVLKDSSQDTGAKNQRRLCCLVYDNVSDMAGMQGVIDGIMKELGVPFKNVKNDGYQYIKMENETYLPGRCGEIKVFGIPIGEIGILHPEVVKNFDLKCPCVAVEVAIELFE